MKWTALFVLAGILTCAVFGQATRRASPAKAQLLTQSSTPAAPQSGFDLGTFVITKTGLLALKGHTNKFLLVPQARFPAELRSVVVLDFQDHVYVARFGEPGGIGVEGFYDICFQIKGEKVLAHSFELGGSLERVSGKVFVRSAAYIYNRADKTVFKVNYGEPAVPAFVAMTNVLSPSATGE